MSRLTLGLAVRTTGLGALALLATFAQPARAQSPAVDPAAVDLLKLTTDYLASLQQFSVTTWNLREDMLESGQRVDVEVWGRATIRRPNKLHGDRREGDFYEILYYDGETVTVYDPRDAVYVQAEAPATIDETLQFIYRWAELYPVSDLIWHGAFPYLMHSVQLAQVIGIEMIQGVPCTHLLFSRPDVDFQIWVPVSGPPLPRKYIVTDNGTPEKLSIVTYLMDWDEAAAAPDSYFTFVPPEGAVQVPLPSTESTDGASR